ncbi:MAG: shikimate kinase [Candidatus Shikimatogenerans sp. JK-2022]|nr:shikimate kinase [Candidatus Shikimatogenerans bostrichidophilus]
MGCGKTNIGKILSLLTNLNFFDLDNIINNLFKIDIKILLNKYGEYKFRILEKKILNFFLKKEKNKSFILSVGGGTPCFLNNIYIMNNIAQTIYLKTDIFTLYNRLIIDNKNRPLLKKYIFKKKLFFFIKKHIKKRENFYKKSKYIIKTKNMSFKQIALYIKEKFKV